MSLSEFDYSGRFSVLPLPNNLPGACAVCGSVERPIVDFGMQIDFYGAVIFCIECIRSAYHTMCTVYPENVSEDQTRVVELERNAVLEDALRKSVTDAVASINDVNTIIDSIFVPVVEEDINTTPTRADESVSDTVKDILGSTKGDDKSSSSKRSDSVSSSKKRTITI